MDESQPNGAQHQPTPFACVRPVTVVIPTRDRPDFLRRAITTALSQQAVDVEVVVVDDGSRDSDAVDRVCRQSGVTLVRLPSRGNVSEARNAGIAASNTQWVAFLDDDDVWAPKKLDLQLRALAEAPEAKWAICGESTLDADLQVLARHPARSHHDFAPVMLRRNEVPGGCSGVVAERESVLAVGGFDPRLSNLADWDLWIRLALASEPAVVPEPLVGYVVHDENMARDVDESERELEIVEDKYRQEQTRPRRFRRPGVIPLVLRRSTSPSRTPSS